METKFDPFWMALVLEKETQTITIAAFAMSKEKAEASARERVSADASLLCVDVLAGGNSLGRNISLWLAENDIVGTENTETVRGIAAEIKKMLDSMRKPKKRWGKHF